ncbi:MAG: DUF4418 family protein [Spirochaetota bacterium]
MPSLTGVTLTLIGITGLIVPSNKVIGICNNPAMACHTTVKLLYPLFAVIAAIGIVLIVAKQKDTVTNAREGGGIHTRSGALIVACCN